MKMTIDSIYNDNQTLFTNNDLLNNDERLTDIVAMSQDLDLITEMSYGAREIFLRYLKEDNHEIYKYNLSKIHKSIYSTILENMIKYQTMLNNDSALIDSDPTKQFYEKSIIGERVRENDFASRVDTTSHGTINTTSSYGDVNIENVTGQSQNTTVNGARENTNSKTSFSTDTFKNTDKVASASATDTQTIGGHTDTSETTRGNDTEQITRGNDSLTHGAHKDVVTDTESIDEKFGYNDFVGQLEKRRNYISRSTLKEIVNDCVNGISYGLYTF